MQKLFWVDLEMTGLDPEVNVIIEFASIVTDWDFNEISCMEAVVYQPQSEIDKMDEWNQRTHGESGLIAKIPSGIPLPKLESQVLEELKSNFGEERPVLAGNSIHQDRKFIDRYMPRLSNALHYRMLDVSALKIVFQNRYAKSFKKETRHRALDDIRESISELKYYLSFIEAPGEELSS